MKKGKCGGSTKNGFKQVDYSKGQGVYFIVATKYCVVVEIRKRNTDCGARAERMLMEKRHQGVEVEVYGFPGMMAMEG